MDVGPYAYVDMYVIVTTEEAVRAVQKLDTGQSSGLDGIFAEHLLHIVVSGC